MNQLNLQQQELRDMLAGMGARAPEQLDEAAVEAAKAQYEAMTVKDIRALANERHVYPDMVGDARNVKKADWVLAMARNDVREAARNERRRAAAAADEAERAERQRMRDEVAAKKRRADEVIAQIRKQIADIESRLTIDKIKAEQDIETLRKMAVEVYTLMTLRDKLGKITELDGQLAKVQAMF